MEGRRRRRREGALLLFAERRRRKLITVSCLPSEEEALQSRPLPPAAQKEAARVRVCVCVLDIPSSKKKEVKEAATPKNDEKANGGPGCSQTPPSARH